MKDVYAKLKPAFEVEERWEGFNRATHYIIDLKTIGEYEDPTLELNKEFSFIDG